MTHLILAIAFLALIAFACAQLPRHTAPTRLCAVPSVPTTCGDVR